MDISFKTTGLVVFILMLNNINALQQPQTIKVANNSDIPIICEYTVPANAIVAIHIMSTDFPRAHISNWAPGVYSSANLAHHFAHKPRLPIWVRIAFNKPVQQTFVDDFFHTLKETSTSLRNLTYCRHGKFKEEFCITVDGYITHEELSELINRANTMLYAKKYRDLMQ